MDGVLIDFSRWGADHVVEQWQDIDLPFADLFAKTRDLVWAMARAYECHTDIVMGGVLASVATMIGKKVYIKYNDMKDYPANYFCIVAPSGSNKTAPINYLLRPLQQRDSQQYDIYTMQLAEWQQSHKKGDETGKPTYVQTVLNDCTPEAMLRALYVNGDGCMVHADEIHSFLANLDRYNKGDSSSQLLSIWSGVPLTVTRKGSEPIRIAEPNLTILGGIQPKIFGQVYGKYINGSGFFGRWLYIYPQHPHINIQRQPLGDENRMHWRDLCQWVMQLSPTEVRLSDDAQSILDAFISSRKKMVREEETDPDMTEYLCKSQIHVWKLAVLAHVLRAEPGEDLPLYISGATMQYAVQLAQVLENNAFRVLKLVRSRGQSVSKEEGIRLLYGLYPTLNQAQLAKALGVSRARINQIVKTQLTP